MIEFEIVIEINRPIDEVFAFLERAENVPLYNVVCKEAHREPEGPIGIGDMSVANYRMLGRSFELTWQFVDYQPPKLLSMRSTSGPMSEKREIKLETTATSETRVLHRYEGETKGFFKFADSLSAPIAKRQMRSAMEGLKELLEKGPAT